MGRSNAFSATVFVFVLIGIGVIWVGAIPEKLAPEKIGDFEDNMDGWEVETGDGWYQVMRSTSWSSTGEWSFVFSPGERYGAVGTTVQTSSRSQLWKMVDLTDVEYLEFDTTMRYGGGQLIDCRPEAATSDGFVTPAIEVWIDNENIVYQHMFKTAACKELPVHIVANVENWEGQHKVSIDAHQFYSDPYCGKTLSCGLFAYVDNIWMGAD